MRIIVWLESAKQFPGVRCPSRRWIDGSAQTLTRCPPFHRSSRRGPLNYSRDGRLWRLSRRRPGTARRRSCPFVRHRWAPLRRLSPKRRNATKSRDGNHKETSRVKQISEENKAWDNKTGMPWRRRSRRRRRRNFWLLRHFIYKNKYEIEHIFTKAYVASKNDRLINK